MNIFQIIILTVAATFTLLWTYQARIRLYYSNINIATLSIVGLWWILLIMAIFKIFNPLHLLWIFPLIVFAMPLLYYKIPGFRYPSFGFYYPCLLINSILEFLLTLVPPKNENIIKLTRIVVKDLTDCVADIYLENSEYNIRNDIELLLKKSIQKYKNVDLASAEIILQKSLPHSINPGGPPRECYS